MPFFSPDLTPARDTICDLRKVATSHQDYSFCDQPGNVDAAYHHGTAEVAKAISKSQHASTPLSGLRAPPGKRVHRIDPLSFLVLRNKISTSSKEKHSRCCL
jgi:hypothetical protein